jgi:parvulin-like peptidyl-prolyl isomerase
MKFPGILNWLCLILAAATHPLLAQQQKAANESQARVGFVYIAAEMVNREYEAMIPSFHGKQHLPEEMQATYRRKALKSAIEKELVSQEAVRIGMRVTDKELQTALHILEQQNNLALKGGIKKAMEQGGQNYTLWLKLFRRELLINKLLQQEIAAKLKVEEHEVSDYYDQQKSNFYLPASVHIQMISVALDKNWEQAKQDAALQKTKKVLEMVKQGADFSQLAYQYSEDPWRVKGGDFGVKHCGTLEAAFEEKALTLQVNELSDIFQSVFGYHVMRLLGKEPGRQLKLEEVAENIKITLLKQKKAQATLRFYQSLAKRTAITPPSASEMVLNPTDR